MAEPNSGLEVNNGGGDAKTTTETTTEILGTVSNNFTEAAGPATADRTSPPPPPPPTAMATTSATSGGAAGGGGPPTSYAHPAFGIPIHVKDSRGKFPRVGSTLGPYFCLGQLGKGTFSSVHKCVNLHYYYNSDDINQNSNKEKYDNNDSKTEDNQPDVTTEATATGMCNSSNRRRLAAAKVELRTFAQSGVLESEATILHFLHDSLPPQTVPVYMGHYKSTNYAAIVMEYLPGEDMNQLRETIIRGGKSRRLHVQDAVYLTADVFLPLLQRMHSVGVIHRDVKPSNAVRMAPTMASARRKQRRKSASPITTDKKNDDDDNDDEGNIYNNKFCLVDFGLSKSIVFPRDSLLADTDHPWPDDRPWLKPAQYHGPACYRKEREKADFRGSSMYASLRVHQGKDYCPRDDVWSVLYVFCDLVSGGLPWMSHAANKERHECGRLKELVQGPEPNSDGGGGDDDDHVIKDEIHQLLMGDEYHVARHRQDYKIAAARRVGQAPPPTASLPPLPIPLPMSQDPHLVGCLRRAFRHVATLQFWDTPNYELIRECIHGFLKDPSKCPNVTKIQWQQKTMEEEGGGEEQDPQLTDKDGDTAIVTDPSTVKTNLETSSVYLPMRRKLPVRNLLSEPDDAAGLANTDLFGDAQEQAIRERQEEREQNSQDSDEYDFLEPLEDPQAKLPLRLQFGLEQMAHHARHVKSVPKHIALRDWLQITWPLIYQKCWNVQLYEESHRIAGDDGFRRPYYLKLLRQCVDWARDFDNFQHAECYFYDPNDNDDWGTTNSDTNMGLLKRRRRSVATSSRKAEDMIQLSKALVSLKLKIREEQDRRSAPPMRLSFGS